MTRTIVAARRSTAALILVIGGGAVAAAIWVSGSRAWALVALGIYLVLAAIAFVWAGRTGDIAAILRVGGDERQRGLDRDATAIAGFVMTLVAIVGAVVEIGRTGDPGVYGLFCAVGGTVYAVSLIELRRRR